MIKIVQQTKLEEMLRQVYEYCEERDIPIFLASWQEPMHQNDDGYVYQYLPPVCLDMDMEELTGEKDKFKLFFKVLARKEKNV